MRKLSNTTYFAHPWLRGFDLRPAWYAPGSMSCSVSACCLCRPIWICYQRLESVHFSWHERWRDLSHTKSTGAKLSVRFMPSAWYKTALTFLRKLIIKIHKSILNPHRPGNLVHMVTLLVHLFRVSARIPITLTEGLVVFLSHFRHFDIILWRTA
jgi:hypothetical protein